LEAKKELERAVLEFITYRTNVYENVKWAELIQDRVKEKTLRKITALFDIAPYSLVEEFPDEGGSTHL
jgi:phosphoribosylaminoimidazole carboxylase (NCAIR synthetase)